MVIHNTVTRRSFQRKRMGCAIYVYAKKKIVDHGTGPGLEINFFFKKKKI
jgi:hypothetical protein